MAENGDKLKEGIAYFEQILQVMPDDRSTLEFLCIAYERSGEREKYQQTLASLAKVLVNERDYENARTLLSKIERRDTPELKTLELKVEAMLKPTREGTKAQPPADGAAARRAARAAAVRAERMLLTWLESNKAIGKDVADKVCEQLQALGKDSGDCLVSSLALLEAENPAVAESASALVADESRVPPIALEAFDSYLTHARELPERLVKERGAVTFGKVADEALVALANPMDEALKTEIAAHFGGKCHFYFAPPLSLGIVLGRLYPESRK